MIHLDDLLQAGGRLAQSAGTNSFPDFSYDSRLTRPGELFLALRTPRADGHDHIAAALAAGAAGVICTHPPAQAGDAAVVLTDNPATLVQHWAARRLQQVQPAVIAVTGSVGKTSTKYAIARLLAAHAPTFESRQSFNSLFGLPVALAHLRDEQRFAVLEFGTSSFGEIRQLASLFPPQIAVVTAVGDAHIDAFGSLAGVAQEKGDLLAALPPDGWAVLNGDDLHVQAMRARTGAQVFTFGCEPGCDLYASSITYTLRHTHMRLCWQGVAGVAAPPAELAVTIPLPGEPAVSIALAAVSVALIWGMLLDEAGALLSEVAPLPGRLNPLPAVGGTLLLDDTFNAALPSVLSGLRTLRDLPAQRRIVVLGELTDLGTQAGAAYHEIGVLAGSFADVLICKGDGGQAVVQAARQAHPQRQAAMQTACRPGHRRCAAGEGQCRGTNGTYFRRVTR
jgi:alanine racemase